jgi:two-component system NtrC family sensor kinase
MKTTSVFFNSILVVDDNPENLKVLSKLLQPEGYKIRISTNGKQALKSIENVPPDLVLLDIQMPEMDGYEVCRLLKKDPKTAAIPIIFISALSQTADKLKGFKYGAVDYIEKPFHFEEVIARVHTHLTIQKQRNDLQLALSELKTTQTQLVQSEKMASLGVLVAGIAHEINNPINFVNAGIDSLKKDYNDIKEFLGLLKSSPQDAIKFAEELSMDDLMVIMLETIEDIKYGAVRTSEIVKGLRNFSRLDNDHLKEADIHEGIDSTLLILNTKYLHRIEIITNYDLSIPEISCFPAQLNQVFMNIINNAIDAIEEEGKIEITTSQDKNNVIISIKDNGKGMSDEVKDKIFDPFFTTKEVGDGVGLGMSISHGIIEKHNGSITVISNKVEGTNFLIKLPLK